MISKKLISTTTALVAALMFTSASFGQSINQLGVYKKWSAYAATENGNKICFMFANPDNGPAGDAKPVSFFYVTQRPAEKGRNEVSYISGYLFQENSLAEVLIGGNRFSFFTKEDGAWIEDIATSDQFVRAMRKGNSMEINGTDTRGVKIQHVFSLSGATAGSRSIENACG